MPDEPSDRIDRIVADLGAEDFEVREKASKDLERAGPQVEPALKRLLASHPSLEARRRAERIAGGVPLSDEVWRSLAATAQAGGLDITRYPTLPARAIA
jgi:hypothetical protein